MRNCFHTEGVTELADRRRHARAVSTKNPLTKQESVVLHLHKFGAPCSFKKQEDKEHEIYLSDNDPL